MFTFHWERSGKNSKHLSALPLHERKRWLHYHSPAEIQPYKLFYCWLKFTDPLPENRTVPTTRFSTETPLVSVFTASYKSKDKIQRPLSFSIESNIY